ncbi:ABC transporter permease [Paenibacillus radicis (ex Xue et al. 2023)]|uniref:Iron ABC transporter permease n=1 Tax=Paenibacillus radicis (ex Xue et al. 2023) TaxID=2972489 RepID=A0ABT1YHK6_9BACL|nr:iron ABC transporter permease [Paenibacillus radicis (ex Xue et al. 2023)]MCR8632666.1 iron ABC transporter permease [Paenibacillus radicis (ex Xue et al. 2023)]
MDTTDSSQQSVPIYKRRHEWIMFKEPWLFAIIVLILLSLFTFSLYPIYEVIKVTVVGDYGFDLNVIAKAITSGYFIHSLWNSVKLGVIAAVLATVIGFVFAYAITKTSMKGKTFFHLIALLPIISPPFVIALSVILLFGRRGIISNGLLGWDNTDVYGLTSLIIIQTLAFYPIAYMNIRGVLESMDGSIEDAALNLGASRWKVFRTVTFPLAIPAIFSAILLVFIKSIEDFGNPMVIAGDYSTLAVQAYMQITGMYDLRSGSFLAISILFPALIVYFLQKYWISKKSYVTVTGKPTSSNNRIREKYIVWPLFAFCALITLSVLLFYGTVVWVSLVKVWGVNNTVTLDNFKYIFTRGFHSIRDSLVLSVIATPITALFGMVIAYLIIRKKFFGKKLMEFSSMLTFAVPGTVVGIGYVLAFNKLPLLLTGTALIIILALTFRNLSVGIEAGTNSLRQVDPSIEEASTNLGANGLTTFWKISLPLMKSALYSGLIYSFIRSMTSISGIIFLISVNWSLLTVSILSEIEASRFGVAAAYCIILIVVVLIALGILQLLVNRLGSKNRRM